MVGFGSNANEDIAPYVMALVGAGGKVANTLALLDWMALTCADDVRSRYERPALQRSHHCSLTLAPMFALTMSHHCVVSEQSKL